MSVFPSTATDQRQLAAELRERINPAYAGTPGTESLVALADDLEAVAPNIEAWFDHTRAAALMRKAAAEIRRLAPLDPDIDVAPGEN